MQEKKYKCMNCGKEITKIIPGDIYSKRFCSEKCHDEYVYT
jgi:DNA-directed RNA polymerase subunit RPC12/RpoP